MRKIRGVSLFASCGIAETYLKNINVHIVTANELVEDRVNLYRSLYKDTDMIPGDILEKSVFNRVLNSAGDEIDFLLASPPCQGLSIAGKNRTIEDYRKDNRNILVNRVIDFIEIKNPDFVLIENVPALMKLQLLNGGGIVNLIDLLKRKFGNQYIIDPRIEDSAAYGVPQRRLRAIIKLFKKDLEWEWPSKEKEITVEQAVGHLPSLEAGESSDIPWHFARKHIGRHILWMKHTPTGKSAFNNKKHYPQKKDGARIKGYESTYRRIRWDAPSPTITIRNDAISSQRNVHPGRKMEDGTYSDARVLTPLELMILSSLPADWKIPEDTPELLIRKCIGECIPPLMMRKIVECAQWRL